MGVQLNSICGGDWDAAEVPELPIYSYGFVWMQP